MPTEEENQSKKISDISGLVAFGAFTEANYRAKLTPYVREKAAAALAKANGDRFAATKLLAQWARKDDLLWRQLREPMEGRGHKPVLLDVAIRAAASS